MAIEAELFDGTVLEFPDGTDPSVIQATAKRITQERQAASKPRVNPEELGAGERLAAAGKRGVESFGEMLGGLGLAKETLTGDTEAATARMQGIKEQKRLEEREGSKTLSAADIGRIYEKEGLLSAAGKVPSYIGEQFLQSAPQMAGPLAVGAAVSPFLTPAGGAIAGIATYGVQQFGNFLVRQAETKKDPEELDLAKAAMTAAGTAPLGYFADRFAIGIGSIGKNAGKEAIAELAKRRALGEVGAGTVAKEVGKGALRGATVGIIAEAPTEFLEQAAERWQAGLALDDEEAKSEYIEALFGGAAVGGGLGGGSRAAQTYGGYRAELPAAREAIAPGTTAFQQAGGTDAGIGLDTGARQLSLPGFDEPGGAAPGTTPVAEGDVAGTAIPPSSVGAGKATEQFALDFAEPPKQEIKDEAPPAPPKLTEAQAATRQELIGKIREAQAYVNEMASINPDDDRIPGAIARIQQLDAELKQLEKKSAVAKPLAAPPQTNKNVAVYENGAYTKEKDEYGNPKATINFTEIVPGNRLYESFYEDFPQFAKGSMDGAIFVHSLNSNERQKGYGNQLIDATIDVANQRNKPVFLIPQSGGGMSNEQLRDWYRRKGFKDYGEFMMYNPSVAKPLPAPSQGGFEFGEADETTQRSVGEAIPKAKLNFAADTNRPLDAVTNFLGALKPDTATPQQVTNYNSEVKGMLEDLREFFGQPAKMVQSRTPGVKVPDVAAELSDKELQLKSALIDDFFNKASITPESASASIPEVLAKLPQMNAEL
jgi:hypothetical protein